MMREQLPCALAAAAQAKEAQAQCACSQAEGYNMYSHRDMQCQCGAAAVQCWTYLEKWNPCAPWAVLFGVLNNPARCWEQSKTSLLNANGNMPLGIKHWLLSDQLSFGAITACLGREVELYLGSEPQAQSYTVIFGFGNELKQTLQPKFWKTKLLNEDSVKPVTSGKTPTYTTLLCVKRKLKMGSTVTFSCNYKPSCMLLLSSQLAQFMVAWQGTEDNWQHNQSLWDEKKLIFSTVLSKTCPIYRPAVEDRPVILHKHSLSKRPPCTYELSLLTLIFWELSQTLKFRSTFQQATGHEMEIIIQYCKIMKEVTSVVVVLNSSKTDELSSTL